MPEEVADRLMAMQQGLDGARWVPFDNFHLTLAFIGDVDPPDLRDINEALSTIDQQPFDLELNGVGHFGDRKPHCVWAGLRDTPDLTILQSSIVTALGRFGIALDRRKFKPHVTLGYLKGFSHEEVEQWRIAYALASERPFPVTEFHLYRSHMGRAGSVYEILETYPLSFSR